MMDPVADNEREQPPADLVPGDSPAVPGPPPAPRPPTDARPPTEVTPDQIRQFQEFQRFQELMREQGDPPPGFVPPWAQPPPKQSLPKRLLKATLSKIITGLVVLAVLVVAGYLAIDYFFGENRDQLPASQTGGGGATVTLLFEKTPSLAVRKIYDDIAQGDGTSACRRFEEPARKQFTKNMSQYGTTCENIVENIHNAVVADRTRSEYSDPWIPASAIPANTEPVSVSSCAIEVTGGPRLGLLTLRKIPNSEGPSNGAGQWIVSAHQAEPEDCGGTLSTPPTS